MGYRKALACVGPRWLCAVLCCTVLAACIPQGSHPNDFFEAATLQLVSTTTASSMKNPRGQQLLPAYVHPQHAHMQGFCFEVHGEEAAVRLQGAVLVQGTIPSDTTAGDQPNQTFAAPTFHTILPKMSQHELASAPVDEVITAQLPIMFRPVSCKSASLLSPGHDFAGVKCKSANQSKELTPDKNTSKLSGDEAAVDAEAFLSAVFNQTASSRRSLGRVVASLHQLAILEEVGQAAEGAFLPLVEVPPAKAHRNLRTIEGIPPGEEETTIFARDYLSPGWKDVATQHARPLHENGVDGEGRAYCKYLPKGTQISATWQPEDNSAGSPFVGKRRLEFWLRMRSVEDPEPLEIILSGKDGDCKHVNTGELQATETTRNWSRYSINLSTFDARQQTQEGDVLDSCSGELDASGIRTITWALPDSLMGSTVCLDEVKLVP